MTNLRDMTAFLDLFMCTSQGSRYHVCRNACRSLLGALIVAFSMPATGLDMDSNPWVEGAEAKQAEIEAWEQAALKKAMSKEIADYIDQFQNTQFGKVVKIGDPAKYQDAINKNINKIYFGPEGAKRMKELADKGYLHRTWLWLSGGKELPPKGQATHHTWKGIGLTADLVFEFDPRSLPEGPNGKKHRQTMMHEISHHLEWLKGIKESSSTLLGYDNPISERNTNYQDAVIDKLWHLMQMEQLLKEGRLNIAEALTRWRDIEMSLHALETGSAAGQHPPDMGLESLTGFSARFDQIEDHYLSGKAGDELRDLAQLYRLLWRLNEKLDLSDLTVKRCESAASTPKLVDMKGNDLGFPPELKPELIWELPDGRQAKGQTLTYMPEKEGEQTIPVSLRITFNKQTMVVAKGTLTLNVQPNPGVVDCDKKPPMQPGGFVTATHQQQDWYCTNRPEIIAPVVLPAILRMMGAPPVPIPLPLPETPR